ncbi:1-phosphatidylinositol 4,5-bisphosphate phosphodiesterase eta-2 [Blomia tropicalis]|nr:1-phosphatidylinositol 4,5-bisphosphate phosphodiesterase eta-2 [Blomia tropicalis]
MKVKPRFYNPLNNHHHQQQPQHHSLTCNFWQLINNRTFKFKFVQRSFHLDIERKLIKVPGIFGLDKKKQINMFDVKEIREGFATDKWIEFKFNQQNNGIEMAENFFYFSIIMKSNSIEIVNIGRSIDLMTDNYQNYCQWLQTMRTLLDEIAELESKIYLKQIALHGNGHGFDTKKIDKLLLETTTFLDSIFIRYAIQNCNFMDKHGLQKFFQVEQDEKKTLAECQAMIAKVNSYIHRGFEIINQTLTENYLSRRGFYYFFQSIQFELFSSEHRKVCQDMSKPMSHYYIASSHNSYLSGNQITSSSSYEMYRKILQNGCRSIEIDIWEDGPDSELVVYHGKTMTSKIFLQGVLETINEVAFVESDYPVIISIENCCKKERSQSRMASMIKEIFQDRLYQSPIGDDETELPSPEKMRGKIFIKGIENLSHDSDSEESDNELSDSDYEFSFHQQSSINDESVLEVDEKESPLLRLIPKKFHRLFERQNSILTIGRTVSPQSSFIEGDFDNDYFEKRDSRYRLSIGDNNKKTQQNSKWSRIKKLSRKSRSRNSFKKIDPHNLSRPESLLQINLQRYNSSEIVNIEEIFSKCSISSKEKSTSFSELINYFKPRKFHSLDDCIGYFQFNEMISRNEMSSKQLIRECLQSYRQFTRTNMVRVYPHAWRQDSSNYIPTDHWNAGAQMVALNYQQISMPMLVNLALFSLNGNCGYVLKPEYIRNPMEQSYDMTQTKMILKIRLICGQFFDKFKRKETNLKVTIRIYSTVDKLRRSTKSIEFEPINPVWNEEFTFKIKNPELSFIQFTLVNRSSYVGHYMISMSAIKKGYRHISLLGRDLKNLKFCRLFLHVDYFNK